MNRNSALVWLPKLQELSLPTPRTEMIPYNHSEIVCIFDGEASPEFSRLMEATKQAAQKIGYPVFIRTDLASAKHHGPDAYLAKDENDIGRVLSRTLEDNELKFCFGPSPEAIMVREFLELDAPFTAFHGWPMAREWRLFADRDQVFCQHPYQPEASLDDYADPSDPNWKELLADLHTTPSEIPTLQEWAIRAAGACGGSWSVDVCRDRAGRWWVTDMATAAASWHWEGCPNEQRRWA